MEYISFFFLKKKGVFNKLQVKKVLKKRKGKRMQIG